MIVVVGRDRVGNLKELQSGRWTWRTWSRNQPLHSSRWLVTAPSNTYALPATFLVSRCDRYPTGPHMKQRAMECKATTPWSQPSNATSRAMRKSSIIRFIQLIVVNHFCKNMVDIVATPPCRETITCSSTCGQVAPVSAAATTTAAIHPRHSRNGTKWLVMGLRRTLNLAEAMRSAYVGIMTPVATVKSVSGVTAWQRQCPLLTVGLMQSCLGPVVCAGLPAATRPVCRQADCNMSTFTSATKQGEEDV